MNDLELLDYKGAMHAMDDDLEIFTEIVECYLETTPQLIDQFTSALEKQDMELFKRSAHSLKSTSRMVGGLQLGDMACQLENSDDSEILMNKDTILPPLFAAYTALKNALVAKGFKEPPEIS